MFNSCCGMRLNTAGMVIGWIGAALSLIAVILFSVGLGRLDDVVKAISEQVNDPDMTEVMIRKGVLIILILYLAFNLINLIASVLLILGTVKERHLMLVPWLINYGVSLSFGLLYCLFIIGSRIGGGAPFAAVAASIIGASLSFAIHIVIWYTIYSLFKKLQANREMQQPLATSAATHPAYSKI